MEKLRFIAGSGRSGTTWVQDAVATANCLRPVFEPLNPYASQIGWKYALRALNPDETHADLKVFLDDVFAGKRARLWTRYRRQWRWFLPRSAELRMASRGPNVLNRWARFAREVPRLAHMASMDSPLVKCIWSNLLLGWLSRRYDCRLVLIVRHPGAVIESELRNKWNAQFAVDRFRNDATFDVMTGGRYRGLLEKNLAPIEGLAVRWLVENQWNIEQATKLPITVVHYEHLSSQSDAAWKRVCDALDLQRAPDKKTISRPSQQSAQHGSAAGTQGEAGPRWQSSLTSEQKGRIQEVLSAGRCDLYSMDSHHPRDSGASTKGALAQEIAR
jgi:hypothetical protein